jgi:hypothetical protein
MFEIHFSVGFLWGIFLENIFPENSHGKPMEK